MGEPLIKIRDLTIENIKKRENSIVKDEFYEALSELYSLRVIKNGNAWYDESIYEYTLSTLLALERIKNNSNNHVKNYLNQTIDEMSEQKNWEVLYVAGIFHNIGKRITLIKNKHNPGLTRYEIVGANIVPEILDKLMISDLEKRVVTNIIKYHGYLHNIVSLKNKFIEKQYEQLMSQQENIFVELNMLAYADTLCSKKLIIENIDEYKFRTEFYKKKLDKF